MHVLYKTPAGSRLYGLSTPESDFDYYTIVDKVKTKRAKFIKHTIVDDIDETVLDLGTWLNQCQGGAPQALEAMFSEMALIDHIESFRRQFVAGTNYNRYLSIMKQMSIDYADSYKHKRHILRLALNMKGLRERGRFNPTLDRLSIELINSLAKLPMNRVYDDALALAWS